MNRLKIGIRLESFGLPLRRALSEAARLGVAGVQVDAVGDLGPDALSETGRREFRHLLRTHNMELTALGCPLLCFSSRFSSWRPWRLGGLFC